MINLGLKLLPVLSILLLSSCVSRLPSAEEFASAYYGKEPTMEQCMEGFKDYMSLSLKDPTTAQYKEGTRPFKGWGKVDDGYGPRQFGWIFSGYVNAKNSYGGYGGFREYKMLWRDGRTQSLTHYLWSSSGGYQFACWEYGDALGSHYREP